MGGEGGGGDLLWKETIASKHLFLTRVKQKENITGVNTRLTDSARGKEKQALTVPVRTTCILKS